MPEPREVRAMFGRIAGRYDLLNRVLSLGIDRGWRRRTVARAGELAQGVVVDACCGTGDLAAAFSRAGARVLGVDFTPEMLRLTGSARRLPGGGYAQGDAMRLPVADAAADVTSIAFGLRNVADRRACMAEMARVLRPGGIVLVLEFGMPTSRIMAGLYRFYFTKVLPRLGGWISGDPGAYRYLPDTVLAWPEAAQLRDEMRAVGLEDCGFEPLTFGVAWLHWGRVPATGTP